MNSSDLINAMQIHSQSAQAYLIRSLPSSKMQTLLSVFDPNEDDLIHICSDYFSVNHGSVGSRGVDYSWD